MDFEKAKQKIEWADQLIRQGKTGNSKEFATKLGICRTTFFELLGYMKELGADLYYDRELYTYLYREDRDLKIGFEKR